MIWVLGAQHDFLQPYADVKQLDINDDVEVRSLSLTGN
jgi:hypothetical protein